MGLCGIPDGIKGTKAEQASVEAAIKWHRAVCEEIAASGCTVYAGAFKARLDKIDRVGKTVPPQMRWAAKLWAAVVLVWDARITCPAVARTRAWHLLDVS